MLDQIYMSGADVGELEIKFVTDALKNGWYENKYFYVEKLEREFAEYHNRKYALMTTNCTHALHLILEGLGVGIGDEVIVPECTWIASCLGVCNLKARPVFCDIEKNSWCLDPKTVIKNITSKTKAIIAVDLYGNMANWNELKKISEEYNIPLIEDAAEAIGSTLNNVRAGKFGLASTFSFHNTKTMTTGEGGMLLLDDENLYNLCLKIRDLGRGPNTKAYYNEFVAEKFMPFNVQAALGLAQFYRLQELVNKKRYILNYYKEALSDFDFIQLNTENETIKNGAWITALVSEKHSKDYLIEELKKHGIPARPFFYPLSSIPAFNNPNGENENAFAISSRGINLPSALSLTQDHLNKICDALKKVLNG